MGAVAPGGGWRPAAAWRGGACHWPLDQVKVPATAEQLEELYGIGPMPLSASSRYRDAQGAPSLDHAEADDFGEEHPVASAGGVAAVSSASRGPPSASSGADEVPDG